MSDELNRPVDPSAAGGWTRRETLKALATGLVALPVLSTASATVLAQAQAGAAPVLAFLTRAQYDAIDALSEAIIPADEKSGGARAARVADYIDLVVSEAHPDIQKAWVTGLAAVEAESTRRFGQPVAKLTEADMTALLTDLSSHESKPGTPPEMFFVTIKDSTIRGYYNSKIGIHDDLDYRGNQILLEFVGCTHPEHGYVAPGK